MWTTFGYKAEGEMRRYQVAQVMSAVWLLVDEFGPREVVRGEIVTREGKEVASFVIRVFG